MATRKLLLFFSLAYGISWLIWLPLYAPALRISLPVYPLPLQHALGGLGPLLAALILKGREGKKEWREYGKSLVRPGSIPHFLAAALLPFVLLVLALWAHQWMSGEDVAWTAFWKSAEFPQWSFPLFLAYNLLFFGYGEEGGWRGYALPLLQRGLSPVSASLALALLWALWHWPLFLYRPGYTAMDAAGVFGWVLSLATGSVLLTWLFRRTRGSVLVCALLHATMDAAFTSAAADGPVMAYVGAGVTVWGAWVLFYRRALSRPYNALIFCGILFALISGHD